jgi:hypothetical protein
MTRRDSGKGSMQKERDSGVVAIWMGMGFKKKVRIQTSVIQYVYRRMLGSGGSGIQEELRGGIAQEDMGFIS